MRPRKGRSMNATRKKPCGLAWIVNWAAPRRGAAIRVCDPPEAGA
jgi:hypothetical protein